MDEVATDRRQRINANSTSLRATNLSIWSEHSILSNLTSMIFILFIAKSNFRQISFQRLVWLDDMGWLKVILIILVMDSWRWGRSYLHISFSLHVMTGLHYTGEQTLVNLEMLDFTISLMLDDRGLNSKIYIVETVLGRWSNGSFGLLHFSIDVDSIWFTGVTI